MIGHLFFKLSSALSDDGGVDHRGGYVCGSILGACGDGYASRRIAILELDAGGCDDHHDVDASECGSVHGGDARAHVFRGAVATLP